MKKLVWLCMLAGVVFAGEYDEPTRPQLRFSQRKGWINDPNGLSYYNGEWHFFFQHNPADIKWGNLSWGHAVSKDLIHWEELGEAILPEPPVLMFSGSAVTDTEGVAGFGKNAHILFYTAAPCGEKAKGMKFSQCIAYSTDGRNYTKYSGNPVVPAIGDDDRDPFVFYHEQSKKWVMVLYVLSNNHHTFRIFNSTDLLHWEQTQELVGVENVGNWRKDGGWRYECPGLVRLLDESGGPAKWVLWGAGPLYDIGDFDGRVFKPQATKLHAWLGDGSCQYYAGQTFNAAPNSRVIKVEWFRMQLGEDGFNQAFSIPQQLTLKKTKDGLRLVRRPVPEMESLRDGPAVSLEDFRGETLEALLSCTPGSDTLLEFDLRGVKLVYNGTSNTLSACGHTVKWPLENGRLDLRVFLDRVGMEVFSRDGLAVFPVAEARPDSKRGDIKYMVKGKAGNPVFKVFKLDSIHRAPVSHYVDSDAGDDTNDGLSPASAWRTLRRVDCASLCPGDKVLFRRGCLWRGGFRSQSGTPGSPVYYGAYGEGSKPILQRSLDRSNPAFWEETSPGIWATAPATPFIGKVEMNLAEDTSAWRCGIPSYMKGSCRWIKEDGRSFMRLQAANPALSAGQVQMWGPEIRDLSDDIVVEFELRSSIPFSPPTINFMTYSGAPWVANYSGEFNVPVVSNTWTRCTVTMHRSYALSRPTYVHWMLGTSLKPGMVLDIRPVSVRSLKMPVHALHADVGIVILDHGKAWGVKKWRLEDLKKDLDYWYDNSARRIFIKMPRNPADTYKSVELALTEHVIVESNRHDVTYENLAVRYTGAHGWCGGDTRNIVIRNCEGYWIGGGLQYWKTPPKGRPYPVRYGNAVEFWGHAVHNLVERNRFWQIYDAATTSQSNGDVRPEFDIVWRDNVIWQAEYSFEYWNHDARSFTGNVVFEHNTCVDAGYCWSHNQRPNPNGAHLMFYDNPCAVTNFVVRNNIFYRGVDRSIRMWNDWREKDPVAKDGLVMENNLYYMPAGKVFELNPGGKTQWAFGAGAEEFEKYRQVTGMDNGSVYGEVQFVDEAKRDYRLKPGSFGTNLATDGGPMGARQ